MIFSLHNKVVQRLVIFSVFVVAIAVIVSLGFSRGSVLKKIQGIHVACNSLAASHKRISCWEKKLVPIIQLYGMKSVLTEVEGLFVRDDNASTGGITKCHDIAHAVGRVGRIQADDTKSAFSQCSNLCGYGCFMGVVDGHLAQGKKIEDEIGEICVKTAHPWPCAHALGHAAGNATGDIHKALELCDGVADVTEREECTSGAFMELFDSSNFTHATTPVPENIYSFCDGLWGEHKTFCFNNMGYLTYLKNNDVEEAVRICVEGQVLEDRKICVSMLSQHLYYTFLGDETHMKQFCDSLDPDLQKSCIDSALLKSVISDPIARHGFGLCKKLSGETRNWCFVTLGAYVEGNDRGAQKRVDLCGELSTRDKQSCLAP